MTTLARARPLLGTLVSVRATFADEQAAAPALEAAFAEIATIHRLMSFHDADSDLSRLNGQTGAVDVDERTAAVLQFALTLARETGGAVDPTIGSLAVHKGGLPRPRSPDPDPDASWRDLDLQGRTVSCSRRLWVDLGGIAKGFAVDRAVELLQAHGARQGCVNAGGDLRIFGPEEEPVALRVSDPVHVAVLTVQEGAAASSGGLPREQTAHFDPRTGACIDPGLFVCVTAPDCMTADALTKAVLVLRGEAGPVLARHGASAHFFDPASGWSSQGAV